MVHTFPHHCVLSLPEALALRAQLRTENIPLVFTNGHFDLLHVGHLDYLEKARALGGALLVAVNDDASTRALKGRGRPIVPAAERARLVAALHCVTAALVFQGETANALISVLQPEIYVKGSDYRHKPLPERDAVAAYGGKVVLIDLLPDHSTSALIARIRALPTDS